MNAIPVKDVYPAPRVDVSIDKMNGALYFAKMDLRSGFYQIRVATEDIHKTAFETECGSFQWLVMPFGLTNLPRTFQSAMDMTFQDMRDFTAVCMDGIVVFSNTWAAHLASLDLVLQRLREAKFYAKHSKCEFASEEIDLSAFVFPGGGYELNLAK